MSKFFSHIYRFPFFWIFLLFSCSDALFCALGMLFHLVMDYLAKVVASHTFIWQLLIQLRKMHYKTRGLHLLSASTLWELVERKTLRTPLVQKLRWLERYVAKSSILHSYWYLVLAYTRIVWNKVPKNHFLGEQPAYSICTCNKA